MYMNASDIIAGFALLVSVASLVYGVREVRKIRLNQGVEKRIELLTNLTKFILLQEQISVEATRISLTNVSCREDWDDIAKNKLDMAKRMRDIYSRLESLNHTDMDYYHELDIQMSDMLEVAKCDLGWLRETRENLEK